MGNSCLLSTTLSTSIRRRVCVTPDATTSSVIADCFREVFSPPLRYRHPRHHRVASTIAPPAPGAYASCVPSFPRRHFLQSHSVQSPILSFRLSTTSAPSLNRLWLVCGTLRCDSFFVVIPKLSPIPTDWSRCCPTPCRRARVIDTSALYAKTALYHSLTTRPDPRAILRLGALCLGMLGCIELNDLRRQVRAVLCARIDRVGRPPAVLCISGYTHHSVRRTQFWGLIDAWATMVQRGPSNGSQSGLDPATIAGSQSPAFHFSLILITSLGCQIFYFIHRCIAPPSLHAAVRPFLQLSFSEPSNISYILSIQT
ncbi:hypothetical protein MSAN_02416000 [Mycena sanguinolenta]|uniref:Uncharacterized protein n=1 Tax=Mycena sanguinolenta TaxID=230812 RepID=A0A8H6X355_9AGAR|nr:hypothetical protein MSAN_02416000 [Mycena sanguinolenta]